MPFASSRSCGTALFTLLVGVIVTNLPRLLSLDGSPVSTALLVIGPVLMLWGIFDLHRAANDEPNLLDLLRSLAPSALWPWAPGHPGREVATCAAFLIAWLGLLACELIRLSGDLVDALLIAACLVSIAIYGRALYRAIRKHWPASR